MTKELKRIWSPKSLELLTHDRFPPPPRSSFVALCISQQNSIPAFAAHILYYPTGEETHLELVKLGGPLNLEENLLVVGVGDLDVKSVGVCKVAIEIKKKKRDMSALVLIII